jgi:Tetratricopeptide repeat
VTFERSLGPGHPNTARTLHYLALVKRDQGRRATAHALLQRAHRLLERAIGPEHRWTLESSRALQEITP